MKNLILIPLLSILFFCINCTTSSSDKENTTNHEADFWDWFQSKSDAYYEFENNQDILFAELSEQLQVIDPKLVFVFGSVKENNKRELVISADGYIDSFESVEKLVAAAPNSLADWEIIAFRQRIGTDFGINYGGIDMKGSDLRFEHFSGSELIKIKLYIPNYDEEDTRYMGASFVLLDNALGEYDVETKIGVLEFLAMPNDTTDLLPFSMLPSVVDRYYE